jgi:hypothetical protein
MEAVGPYEILMPSIYCFVSIRKQYLSTRLHGVTFSGSKWQYAGNSKCMGSGGGAGGGSTRRRDGVTQVSCYSPTVTACMCSQQLLHYSLSGSLSCLSLLPLSSFHSSLSAFVIFIFLFPILFLS